jgi:Cys-tRNA(Pro)/Cys-tRNA(Cys) deacylase
MVAITKTLDANGIKYEVRKHKRAALTCETAALERGVRVSQIVKFMIGETEDGRLIVMLIPGDRMLKTSKARKFLGARSLNLVSAERLRTEHALVVGAISPVQFLDEGEFLMDPSVLEEQIVDISSGDPLAGIEIRSVDLTHLLKPAIVEMVSSKTV